MFSKLAQRNSPLKPSRLHVPEIARIICEYAVPDDLWDKRYYDIIRPDGKDLTRYDSVYSMPYAQRLSGFLSFSLVCRTWWRTVQARRVLYDNFYIGTASRPWIKHAAMVKEPGFSTFFSLFASGHLRRDQVKSLLLLIQDDDSGSLEDDFPDFDNGPTLSWALKQDWTFSNLTSFHLNVLYCAVDDANFKLIQQLLLQIPQVQILRVYGDSEFNEAIHIWSSQLELSMILQNSKLRKIWLQGLHITVDVPAAAVLTNLALVGCKLTYDDLAMLLFSSTKRSDYHTTGYLDAR